MVSPFNIEDIISDVDPGPLRLPRRQAGSSSQGLTVTLVADYTLHARAWLPSAAVVALLAESGVTVGAARTAISRLARRGVLENNRHGRHSYYRLTQAAAEHLSAGGSWIADFTLGDDEWDGWWTQIAFSLPQHENAKRRTLRGQLRWLGYAPLYDALWVSPHPLTPKAQAELAAVAPGAMTVFRARHVDSGGNSSRAPIDAWDVAAIARQYDGFLRRWGPLVTDIESRAVTGADAVRARTEVMDTYRRFPVLDPLLPIELLPAEWPRARAREVFVAVYDGLAGPAQEHVQAVVSGAADGPHSGIGTHTVAEMRAGVSGAARG